MTEKREEWEKDFTGLKPFTLLNSKDDHMRAAKKCDIRMEFKELPGGGYELYCEPDQDLTEFWIEVGV